MLAFRKVPRSYLAHPDRLNVPTADDHDAASLQFIPCHAREMKLLLGLITGAALVTASCDETPQQKQINARSFGGTSTQDLPENKKLVMITWKDTDLWILTRDRRPEEKPERYEFKERSTYGIWQGTVVIQEH
jgi:hypothetical protein